MNATKSGLEVWMRPMRGPRIIATFSVNVQLTDGLQCRLNDGLIVRKLHKDNAFDITYPSGPTGPIWLFEGLSQRQFDLIIAGKLMMAMHDARWQADKWFRVE